LLRSEIISSSEKILAALTSSNIERLHEFAYGARPQRDQVTTNVSLEAFKNYTIYANSFNEMDRSIAHILEIEALGDPSWWAKFLDISEGKRQLEEDVINVLNSSSICIRYLPRYIKLFSRSSASDAAMSSLEGLAADRLEESATGGTLLTVILPEDDLRFSSPRRITMTLESIDALYGMLAELEGMPSSGLVVSACDSGSNKVFDFKGISKVIDGLRQLILSIWHQVIYHEEKKFSERLEIIKNSLPILEKIKEMEKSGSISPEHAERFRRQLADGVSGFLEVGARIPEMKVHSRFEPDKLLATNETLLLPPPAEPPT
jgi:hypothetical protein